MIRAFYSIIAALILSSVAAPLVAGPFEDGAGAYDKGDYRTALQFFRPLAEQGFSPAQGLIGIMLRTRSGCSSELCGGG